MPTLSWTALEKLHDHFARAAIGICNKGDEVAQQLFLVEPRETGEVANMAALPPSSAAHFYRDSAGKDHLAQFIKAVLTEGHPLREALAAELGFEPTVLVQVCEAWTLILRDGDNADYTSGKKAVSEAPDRREAVVVTLHTREGSIPVPHPIEPAPLRHCVQGRFPRFEDHPLFSGRFSMQDAFAADKPTH